MIDVSDGLSSDLSHLCEESGTGALLFSDKIPLSPALLRSADRLRKPPLHYALSGGEDYELLFTVPLARMRTLETAAYSGYRDRDDHDGECDVFR